MPSIFRSKKEDEEEEKKKSGTGFASQVRASQGAVQAPATQASSGTGFASQVRSAQNVGKKTYSGVPSWWNEDTTTTTAATRRKPANEVVTASTRALSNTHDLEDAWAHQQATNGLVGSLRSAARSAAEEEAKAQRSVLNVVSPGWSALSNQGVKDELSKYQAIPEGTKNLANDLPLSNPRTRFQADLTAAARRTAEEKAQKELANAIPGSIFMTNEGLRQASAKYLDENLPKIKNGYESSPLRIDAGKELVRKAEDANLARRTQQAYEQAQASKKRIETEAWNPENSYWNSDYMRRREKYASEPEFKEYYDGKRQLTEDEIAQHRIRDAYTDDPMDVAVYNYVLKKYGNEAADKLYALHDNTANENVSKQLEQNYYDRNMVQYLNGMAQMYGWDAPQKALENGVQLSDEEKAYIYTLTTSKASDFKKNSGDLYDYENRPGEFLVDNHTTEHMLQAANGYNDEAISPSEKQTLNYLYRTGQYDKLDEYAAVLGEGRDRKRTMMTIEKYQNFAEREPFWASVHSVIASPLKGISYIGQVIDYIADGKINENAGYNDFARIPDTIRGTISNNIAEATKEVFKGNVNWASVGYQTGMSMADFLYNALISGAFSAGVTATEAGKKAAEWVTLAIMGSGAAATETLEAKKRGLTDGQSLALGTIAGIAEVVTEKVSLDKLLNPDFSRGIANYIFENAFVEGAEEVGSDLINNFADVLIASDKSKLMQRMRELENEGFSQNRAFAMALTEQARDTGMSFLGGAVSGAVMAGGGSLMQYQNFKTAKTIGSFFDRIAAESYADKLQSLTDDGKKRLVNEAIDVLPMAGKMSSGSRDVFVRNWNTDQRVTGYVDDMSTAYNAGRGGELNVDILYDEGLIRNGTSRISIEQAFKAGQIDMQADQEIRAKEAAETQALTNSPAPVTMEQEEFQKGEDYGGESLGRSEEWNAGLDTRKQARTVEESARRFAGKTAEELGRPVSQFQQKRTLKASEVYRNGSKRSTITEVEYNEKTASDDERSSRSLLVAAGVKERNIHYFTGVMRDSKGHVVQAWTDGNSVWVPVDNKRFTAKQMAMHESLHVLAKKGAIDVNGIADWMKTNRSYAWNNLVDQYKEAYQGADMTESEIIEEIIADGMGGVNIYAGSLGLKQNNIATFMPAVQTAIEQVTGKTVDEIHVAGNVSIEQDGEVVFSRAVTDEDRNSIMGAVRNVLPQLNKMDSVYTVTETIRNGEKTADFLRRVYPQIGESVNRKGYGTVQLPFKRLKSAKGYRLTSAEVQAFLAVPAVIEKGIEAKHTENFKFRDYSSTIFAAPITIGGEQRMMGVAVKKTTANFYKMHRLLLPDGTVLKIEEADLEHAGVGAMNGSIAQHTDLLKNNLAEDGEDVKTSLAPKEFNGDDSFYGVDQSGNKFSLKSLQTDISEGRMRQDLLDSGFTLQETERLFKNLDSLAKYIAEPGRVEILDMNETEEREDRVYKPYKPNSDPLYKVSLDYSTMCRKRLMTQFVIEQLQLQEHRVMSAEEQLAIREKLKEYRDQDNALQVACAMCYVEAARLKSPKQMNRYFADPAAVVSKYLAFQDENYNAYIENVKGDIKEALGYDRNAAKKSMKGKDATLMNKITQKLRSGKAYSELTPAEQRVISELDYQPYTASEENQKIIEDARNIPVDSYLSAANLTRLSREHPEIYAAYTNHVRESTHSKGVEQDVAYYYGDADVISDRFIENVNRENGMRANSWSDFQFTHLLDQIVATIELHNRGASMHSYTKFLEQVRIFGRTGQMFNLSGVAEGNGFNSDGSLNFSDTESVHVNNTPEHLKVVEQVREAFQRLRKQNPNGRYTIDDALQEAGIKELDDYDALIAREEFPETAGLQCIAVNDKHLRALLRSDLIDYVIPYHTSGMNATLRRMAGIAKWQDFTKTQNAKGTAVEPVFSEFMLPKSEWGNKTGVEIMRESAQRYVDMCEERGLTPKFDDYIDEDNYWKLLIDRKMVDQQTGKIIEQQVVKPDFDFDRIYQEIDQYVDNYDRNVENNALKYVRDHWDAVQESIPELKKRGAAKTAIREATKVENQRREAAMRVDTLANQTLAAQPESFDDSVKNSMQPVDFDDAGYRELTNTINELRAELKKQTARAEYFKGQTRLSTNRGQVDTASVEKFTRSVLKEYASKAGFNSTKTAMTDYANWMRQTIDELKNVDDEARWIQFEDEAYTRAVDLMRPVVLDTETLVNEDAVQTGKDIRAYLKGGRGISISDADQRAVYTLGYDSFQDYRKRNFGNLKITKDGPRIDQVWSELQDQFGKDFFPDDIQNTLEQLGRIDEVLSELNPIYANPFDSNAYNAEEAIDYAARNIMSRVLSDEVKDTAPTFSDKMHDRLEAARKEATRRVQEVRKEARQKNEEKIAALKKHYAEVNKNRVDLSRMSKERQRLLKIAKRLLNRKLPAVNKAWVQEMVGNLDLAAQSITGRKLKNLQELYEWYEEQKQSADFIEMPQIEKQLQRLAKRQMGTAREALNAERHGLHFDGMTQQEVLDLTEALLNFEHQLDTRDKLINSEDKRSVYAMTLDVLQDIENSKGINFGRDNKLYMGVRNFVIDETLNPRSMFHRIAGYNENDPLYQRYIELNEGQHASMTYEMNALDEFKDWMNDKEFQRDHVGRHAKTVTATFGGKEVTMTRDVLISLYMHSLNDDNLRHLSRSGIEIPDAEALKRNNLERAYENTTKVRIQPSELKALFQGEGKLTEKEMSFVRAMQKYFAETSQKELNRVSLDLYGYERANEENYWPIEVDKNFLRQDANALFKASESTGEITMDPGFLQSRIEASQTIVGRGALDVLRSSIHKNANFIGFAVPIRNFSKIYAAKSVDFEELPSFRGQTYAAIDQASVRDLIEKKWGQQANKYIAKLINDAQGIRANEGQFVRTLKKFRSNYAGAVLTLNLSVALKQAASYPTAAAVLGWKPLLQAFGLKFYSQVDRVDLDLIKKYTPLLDYRRKGFTDSERGELAQRNIHVPAALNWIQGMDVLTTQKLWRASEYYVQDNFKALERRSDPYYRKVAEIFNEVIERTQPNYTTMQRPGNLRGDFITTSINMFRTQPFQNFNILYDAFGNYAAKARALKLATGENLTQAKADFKQARTDLWHSLSAIAVSSAVFAAMSFAWGLLRRKKEPEDAEKEIAKNIGSALAGMVPFGSDVYDLVSSWVFREKYWGYETVTSSSINDFANALNTVVTTAQDGKEVKVKDVVSLANYAAQLLGVPLSNMLNLMNIGFAWAGQGSIQDYIQDQIPPEDANWVYQQRKKAKVTTKQIAEACGVQESTVRNWQSGTIPNMSKERKAKLADLLGISVERLEKEIKISKGEE